MGIHIIVNKIYLVTKEDNLIIKELSYLFNINIIDTIPDNYSDCYLEFYNNKLWIKHNNLIKLNLDELYETIIKRLNRKNELIIKANKHNNINNDKVLILDLTAGLGKDSLILQKNNFQITMVEYNPLLVIILNYAKLKGYFNNSTSIIQSNSYDFFKKNYTNISPNNKINIYLDPMFKQNKTAKPKKNMQYIDLLTINNNISNTDKELFDLCYNNDNISKIIIKRDNKQAEITNEFKPNYALKSKLIRFDIYQK